MEHWVAVSDITLLVSGMLLALAGALVMLGWVHPALSHLTALGLMDGLAALALLMRQGDQTPLESGAVGAGILVAYMHFILTSASRRPGWHARLWSLIPPVLLLIMALPPAQAAMLAALGLVGLCVQAGSISAWFVRLLWRERLPLRRPFSGLLVFLLPALGLQTTVLAWPGWRGGVLDFALAAVLVAGSLGALAMQARVMRRATRELQASRWRLIQAREDMEAQIDDLARERVQAEAGQERRRIAADLHDDLGARLLTIVHTCPDPSTVDLVREALDDMRLSVRGLVGRVTPLAHALGDWRSELVQRLEQADIVCDWRVLDGDDDAAALTPERLVLTPEVYVHTTRILREITSNIIRHAGAAHCSVRVTLLPSHMEWDVADDGRGIRADNPRLQSVGLGVLGMKMRAKRLGGQCLIESRPGQGTRVRLSMPVQPLEADTPLAPAEKTPASVK
ncbi:sensor histidine kinase [Amphibiibacter pelophylacis]|uniref:ATP-binding protein n=1 Tax=Amphibiibacter pelophylacis TaxID=1799477 RepID=A0ACC6P2B9_9BURK